MTATPDYRHKEHPKRCAPDDFWGQVSRTIHGQPVGDDQIRMILKAIRTQLSLRPSDNLLDLGCGNGALAHFLFDQIASYTGVDFSAFLIDVAQANFTRPHTQFLCQDVVQYVHNEPRPDRFTKALCYGAFMYLSRESARDLLDALRKRFINVSRWMIGNLPDRDRAHQFYNADVEYQSLLDDRTAAIGIWRTREEFRQLASETGWSIEFSEMPASFYGSHYRYDVVLHRGEDQH